MPNPIPLPYSLCAPPSSSSPLGSAAEARDGGANAHSDRQAVTRLLAVGSALGIAADCKHVLSHPHQISPIEGENLFFYEYYSFPIKENDGLCDLLISI